MQDRYAGDVGDFFKLGLLRQLVAPDTTGVGLRLGVVWYRVPDDGHNADGKHVTYLSAESTLGPSLRAMDPVLYDRLRTMVDSGARSIASLEQAAVLPAETRYFSEPLDLNHLAPSARHDRIEHRRRWSTRALQATLDSELVFVDPDNGLRRNDHPTASHHTRAEKHAYHDELVPFVARGQSLVAYHHADRSAPVAVQAQRRLEETADALGVEPLAAVKAARGTVRLFLVVPAPAHRVRLREQLERVEHSAWGTELTVIWWNRWAAPPSASVP